ncbi:MAG: iron-containing alcohol dehydrogenase [Eubacteriales bacterium]|nr:iron-containing alcohol dehydrogenase [Eubacteriales bacterium]
MLSQYTLQMPKCVYGGENALENLRQIVRPYKKVAIFADQGIVAAGLTDSVIAELEIAEKAYTIFADIEAEPSYLQVQKLVDEFKHSSCDFIVAIGGGSVMDTAKLASLLVTDDYGVKELLDKPLLATKCVETLLIPTTAGTGSEATSNAIVGVPEQEVKIGIVNAEMIADYVILDPVMIKNLPRPIAASTGIDALCHAIECYTSKKANNFSDMFALRALDLILNNIEEACSDKEAIKAKILMQTASFFAGVAITASGTTAVHALSYPMGGKYHIPHGIANAVLLIPVMKFNEPFIREKLAECYDACVHGEKTCNSLEEKSAYMIQWMESIVRRLDIPTSYREWEVTREDLDGLVEAGMQQQRLLVNNMREITSEDARAIYGQVI